MSNDQLSKTPGTKTILNLLPNTPGTRTLILLCGVLSLVVTYGNATGSPVTRPVQGPIVTSFKISTQSITGGTNVTATISLDRAAPLNAFNVPLASDSPTVTVPASVTVPGGRTSASFLITTVAVASDTLVRISAGPNETPQVANLTVLAPVVSALTLSAQTVVGGQPVRASLGLSGPAPANGLRVQLSSSSSIASIPSTVAFSSGQKSTSVDITTNRVTADTPVTISVRSAERIAANLTVTLPLVPELLSMTSAPSATETTLHHINLVLDRPSPAQHRVNLTSSSPSVLVVPQSFIFPTGLTNFLVPIETGQVEVDTSATITATSGNSTKTVNITVLPLTINTLTLPVSSITGGSGSTVSLALNQTRDSDTVITLTSSDASLLLPGSITIPKRLPGSAPPTITFDVFTQSVPTARSVTIIAKLPADVGGGNKTLAFSVSPVTLASLTLVTHRCDVTRSCSGSVSGTVTLDGPAPSEGISLSLSSDKAQAATVPAILLIPSGQTTKQFNVSIQPNAGSGRVTITVIAGSGSAKTVTLDLVRTVLEVESVTLNTSQTQGGSPITGTVTVRQVERMGSEATVTPTSFATRVVIGGVKDNNTFGTATPATLIVPSGQSSGQFTYTPPGVASPTTVRIDAVVDVLAMGSLAGGVLRSVDLTVNPPSIQSLALSQSNVQGGQQVTGTIQMSGPVPAGSLLVTSSDPNVATLNVTTSLYGSPGTFTINTSAAVISPATVIISAAFAGQTATATLNVTKPSVLQAVSFPAQRLFTHVPTTVKFELDGPAPSGGAIINVQSGNQQVIPLFQQQITIPAGQSLATIPIEPGNASNPVQASVFANYRNESKSATVTIEPLFLDVCSSSTGQGVVGGSQITCAVTILTNGMVAPAGGLQLSVQNSNPSILTTSSTLTIPAGQSSTTLQISTQQVTQTTNANISLVMPSLSINRTFTITPP